MYGFYVDKAGTRIRKTRVEHYILLFSILHGKSTELKKQTASIYRTGGFVYEVSIRDFDQRERTVM